jgi:type II pantothenate kinase
MAFINPSSHSYPYLLVNIGSGVSMIKVSGPRDFVRVGGTSLGGGTLWGLLSLLTGARNFEEMLAMAERGDNTAVDMLVGDIYGSDYGKIGLKATTIASSFGKVYRMKRQAEREAEDHGGLANGYHIRHSSPSSSPSPSSQSHDPESPELESESSGIHFRPEDISRSLLYAISNNIGQIAYLHAEKHNCSHIYFGGSFIGGHWQTMATLSYAIKFWSKGAKKAYFLRHEGYLGAVGAFLKRQPRGWGRRGSLDLGGLSAHLERVVTDIYIVWGVRRGVDRKRWVRVMCMAGGREGIMAIPTAGGSHNGYLILSSFEV